MAYTSKAKQMSKSDYVDNLCRFIYSNYEQHGMFESACAAMAKKRMKGSFPKESVEKVLSIVVNNAKRWYNWYNKDNGRKLPPLNGELREMAVRKLYPTAEKHIKDMISYYKYIKK